MLENAVFVHAFAYMFELTVTGWCIIATYVFYIASTVYLSTWPFLGCKQKVKSLLKLEKLWFIQRLITSLRFVTQNVTISVYLLFVGRQSLTISVQEDESIWKILAMENLLSDIGFKT